MEETMVNPIPLEEEPDGGPAEESLHADPEEESSPCLEASPPAERPPAAVPSDHAAALPPEEAKEAEAAPEEEEPLPDFTDLLARYPGFDPATEGRDPAFTSLLAAGVAPDRAYEVLHLDQLLQGAMDYAARRTLERLAGANLAAAARPAENGLHPGSTATHSFDPRTLTPEQARDLRSRVFRGEKIYL